MNRILKVSGILVGLMYMFVALSAAHAADEKKGAKYLGAAACKGCHKAEFGHWESTKHAKALASLKGDDLKNEKCLKCHVTGLGKEKGFDVKAADKDKEKMANVQCESCHGPGGDYMKVMVKAKSGEWNKDEAVKAGMIIPDEKTCTSCHNSESPNFKEFKFKDMLPKVKHPAKEAK